MEDSTENILTPILESIENYTSLFALLSLLLIFVAFIFLIIINSKLKKVATTEGIALTNEGVEGVKMNFTKQLEKFKKELIDETNESKNEHTKEMEDLKSHLSNYNRNLYTRNTFIMDGLLDLNASYSQWLNYLKNIYYPSITADTKYFEEIKKNLNQYRTAFGSTLDNLSVVALDKELSEVGKVLKKETQALERLTMLKLMKVEKLKIKYSILLDSDKQSGVLREEERKKLLLEEVEVKKENSEEFISQYKKVYHVFTQFTTHLNQQVNKTI